MTWDEASEAALRRKIDGKTKPLGALGRIEGLAAQVARTSGTLAPRMRTCQLTIFAGDHGLAAEGVSAYPQAVTRQMLLNFLDGNAAANVFARSVGAALRVVDAGVAGAPVEHPDLLSRRIAAGTRNALREPAMTAGRARPGARRGPGARRRRRLGRRRLRRDGHRQHLGRRRSSRTRSPACRSTTSSGAAPASTTPGSARKRAILERRRAADAARRCRPRRRWPSTAASRSR